MRRPGRRAFARTSLVAAALAALAYVAVAAQSGESKTVELTGQSRAAELGFSVSSDVRRALVRGWEVKVAGVPRGPWHLADASPDGFASVSPTPLWIRPPFHPAAVYLDSREVDSGRAVAVPSGRHQVVFLPAFPTAGVPGALPAGFRYTYGDRYRGWPVSPTHERHPVRGGFLDARTGGYHFGIDISVDDLKPEPGAPKRRTHRVYALEGGPAHLHNGDRRVGCVNRRLEVGHFAYWHVDPTVAEGEPIRPGEMIGWTCRGDFHVHLSEWAIVDGRRTWVNPLHRGGKLEPYSNDAPPVVEAVRFFTPPRTPWLHWNDLDTATQLAPQRLHGQVEVRANVEDAETFLGFLHLDRRLPAPDPPYRLGIEIRDAQGNVVLRRVAFQADTFLTAPWQVHFAPGTEPDLSVIRCLQSPIGVPCAAQHWYRPLSRTKLEYWDTRKVRNGRYVVTVVAWDNRDNIGIGRAPVVVAN